MSKPNFVFERCSSCGCPATTQKNPKTGTLFYGCTAHDHTGCRWTASPETGEEWGNAATVARRSSKRGRATSLHASTIARLRGIHKMAEAEAEAFIAAVGLVEAAALAS